MKANLRIIFCSFNNCPHFKEFMLNGEYFPISESKREIELKVSFDNYEQDLGKKVCEYELLTEKREFHFGGSFEIGHGDNIGFCFIDNVGTTFELLFLEKIEQIESFINSNFTSSVLDACYSKVDI